MLLFLINVWHTHRKAPPAPLDPWDARTLEWMTTNPPKEHNFDSLPEVHALDEFFHRKYEDVGEGDAHDLRKVATAEEILAEQEAHADHHIHMPSPSYWPMLRRAWRCRSSASAIIYNHLIADRRRPSLLVLAVFGWAMEPSVADDSDYDPPADDAGPGTDVATVGSRVVSTPTAPEDKTPGHGAPDLGNEPTDSGDSAVETIDQIPMGGVPEPGPSTDDGAGGSGLTDMPNPSTSTHASAHGPAGTIITEAGSRVADPEQDEHPALEPPTGLSNNKMGMWLFLGSECLLFGGLISTYMLYRGRHGRRPRPGPDLRHPVHVGVELRAADVVAHDGARRVGGAPRRRAQHAGVARHDGRARRHVRRRSGVRVHVVLPRGARLHHEPVLVELLHADRVPRRARHARHHHAAGARR